MSKIVAVAGGTSGLGRAIIDALRADERFKPFVLSRKSNQEIERDVGVPVISVDYTNVDSLVKPLNEHNIDTIISTINSMGDLKPELNLIQASEKSSCTTRFMPNIWSGIDYTDEQVQTLPYAQIKDQLKQAMKATHLEWTAIYPGVFLDYYVPNLPTYMESFPFGVDTENNFAAIPGSGNTPVTFTHNFDIAKFTAALLAVNKWDEKYYLAGDTVTWNELLTFAETAKGVKFQTTYDSPDKLKKGEVTEMPVHVAMYERFGGRNSKPMVQKMLAEMSLIIDEGGCNYLGKTLLNDMFPEIETLKVKEALERNFNSA